jgi:glutaredoxin-like protein NrdH
MAKKIKIYALSTCIWCKKTIEFFTKKGVAFEHIYVDLLDENERVKIDQEIEAYNSGGDFPTVVIDGKVIVGYKVKEFEKELEK